MKCKAKTGLLQICTALFLCGVTGMAHGAQGGNISFRILADDPLTGLDAGSEYGVRSDGKQGGVSAYAECEREADRLAGLLNGVERNDTLCYSLYRRFMDMRQYDRAGDVAARALAFSGLQGEWKYMRAMAMLKMGENGEGMRLLGESLSDCELEPRKAGDIARTSFLLNLKCLLGMKDEALADLRANRQGEASGRLPHTRMVEFAIKDFSRQKAVRCFMESFLYADDGRTGGRVCASATYKDCLARISSLGSGAADGTLSESDMWRLLEAYAATRRMDEAKALAAKGEKMFPDNGDWSAARAAIDLSCGASREEVGRLVRAAADKYRACLDKEFDPLLCLRYVKAQCAASPESDSAKMLASFGKEFMAYERQGDLKFCVTYDILSLRLGTSFYDDWAGTLFPDFVV